MTCDVLIIGGGLMGCATAFDLAKRGHSVIVSEKNAAPGMETALKSSAIIGCHYGVPELANMALEANKRFLSFSEIYGGGAGFMQCGYSVLTNEFDVPALKSHVEMHRKIGVDVNLIDPAELKKLLPALKIEDIALAAHEPNGGYANPLQTIKSFSCGAERHGAKFLYNSPVLDVHAVGEGWAVNLGSGKVVHCAQIVICTGNWSREVGRLFDLDLPVVPMRTQIVVVERPPSFRGNFPIVSDLIGLAYFRPDSENGIWIGSCDSTDLKDFQPVPARNSPISYNNEVDNKALCDAKHKVAARFEGIDALDKGGVQRAFCGLYETTPDWQPIIDSFETVHIAVGFSGHGFKLSTIIGEEMACRIEGIKSPFPTQIFDAARFDEGRSITSQYRYERAKFLR